jgi:two-component system, chemotaxis family, protein-glutamate methylesterase/glutaminase
MAVQPRQRRNERNATFVPFVYPRQAEFALANRDILAIGTSAGGVGALRFLASRLPRDLPASVLVVLHLPSQFRSSLDQILSQSGPLPATFGEDGTRLEKGHVYLAPPGSHLLLEGDRLRLGRGPRENNSRPAIDPLFRSVALCCAPRAIGVVLTGTLGDGAAGLHTLKQCGGLTVVQDPNDAAYPQMPLNALRRTRPHHVTKLEELPELLSQLVAQPVGEAGLSPPELAYEVAVALGGAGSMDCMDKLGRRSALACPDCHGTMWEIDDNGLLRYRCHVGHAYTAELLSLALDENLTRALGSALRALDERIALAKKLHQDAERSGYPSMAEVWERKLRDFEREAELLRTSLRRLDEISARSANNTNA